MSNFFKKLKDIAEIINTKVDESVVKVVRSANPIHVEPGLTAIESAIRADHLDEEHANVATFQIEHIDGSIDFVAPTYICSGGETLTIIVNRDGKA